jgi:hypothetical protein
MIMSWFQIINKKVDMKELMARIRAEQTESESSKEQQRREKLGLPEEDIDDGIILNWAGECPKCGAKISKDKIIKSMDSDFRPRHNIRQPRREIIIIKCPYFKKAGKMKGKFKRAFLTFYTVKGKTQDISKTDECPMAALLPPKNIGETAMMTSGQTVPNPYYDPAKEEDEI